MDSFLLLRRLVAAIVFKGQTVSDYWWSRRTIFLTLVEVKVYVKPNVTQQGHAGEGSLSGISFLGKSAFIGVVWGRRCQYGGSRNPTPLAPGCTLRFVNLAGELAVEELPSESPRGLQALDEPPPPRSIDVPRRRGNRGVVGLAD